MYHAITDNYENSISFIAPYNRVQRFRTGGTSELACNLAGAYYFALSIEDENVQENYSAPYSQTQINASPLISGVGIANRLPKLRTRVVTYKMLILSPRNIWTGNNQTWRTGRGAKQRVRDFIRDFLEYGNIKVQYGTWGGVDLGGYLVDEPQVSYNSEETQATLTFTLQFTNPVTLHPNFTNSRLWSSETEQIDWSTLTTADNGNLRAETATRNATSGALSAEFKYVKRISNIGFMYTAGTVEPTGTLTIKRGSEVVGQIKSSMAANKITIYTAPASYVISPTLANNAANLGSFAPASRSNVGVSVMPPAVTCSVTFTPDNAASTENVYGRFILLGW